MSQAMHIRLVIVVPKSRSRSLSLSHHPVRSPEHRAGIGTRLYCHSSCQCPLLALSGYSEAATNRFKADMGRRCCNVHLSNRPVWVKRFQTIHWSVSTSLTGSCVSSESAPGPFHIRRLVQVDIRSHSYPSSGEGHRSTRGGARVLFNVVWTAKQSKNQG